MKPLGVGVQVALPRWKRPVPEKRMKGPVGRQCLGSGESDKLSEGQLVILPIDKGIPAETRALVQRDLAFTGWV